MRIIILGAGRVGESVAESLVSEQNDITMIDPDPERLRDLEGRLDLRGVPGNGIQPSVLRSAGAADADMFIACAALDETNLTACKVAKSIFNIETTIARVRSPEFEEGTELLGKEGFAVDHVICPEESVMHTILQLIDYPEALQVLEFSQGRARLIAVRAAEGSRLANQRGMRLKRRSAPARPPGSGPSHPGTAARRRRPGGPSSRRWPAGGPPRSAGRSARRRSAQR